MILINQIKGTDDGTQRSRKQFHDGSRNGFTLKMTSDLRVGAPCRLPGSLVINCSRLDDPTHCARASS